MFIHLLNLLRVIHRIGFSVQPIKPEDGSLATDTAATVFESARWRWNADDGINPAFKSISWSVGFFLPSSSSSSGHLEFAVGKSFLWATYNNKYDTLFDEPFRCGKRKRRNRLSAAFTCRTYGKCLLILSSFFTVPRMYLPKGAQKTQQRRLG